MITPFLKTILMVAGLNSVAIAATESSQTFRRDDRPIDGALQEVSIVSKAHGHYKVTYRVAYIDRLTSQVYDKTKVLADDMRCAITPFEIVCSRDLRPVDGALTKISIVSQDEVTFDATLYKEYFNRQTGKTEKKSSYIAKGMSTWIEPKEDEVTWPPVLD